MNPVQMFRGSRCDVAKHAVLLGCDTPLVNGQFPIFQTTHCLHVQGVKQSKTTQLQHYTAHYNLL